MWVVWVAGGGGGFVSAAASFVFLGPDEAV